MSILNDSLPSNTIFEMIPTLLFTRNINFVWSMKHPQTKQKNWNLIDKCFKRESKLISVLYLDTPTSLKLYPEIEWIKKKKGSKLSVMCTTESMRYYSSNFNWFKENRGLPNTTDLVRHSTSLRLNFESLKLKDSGKYNCNITDDETIQGKSFQLTVFGMLFVLIYFGKKIGAMKHYSISTIETSLCRVFKSRIVNKVIKTISSNFFLFFFF